MLLLETSDVRLDDDLVWYNILKQQCGEDNREYGKLRDDRERRLPSKPQDETEGALFDVMLNELREELRRVQKEHDIPQLKLKDFRHTRVSNLKAAGWSDVKIRDEYTKHKHLSTDEPVRPEITHNGEGDIYFVDADYASQIGVDIVE